MTNTKNYIFNHHTVLDIFKAYHSFLDMNDDYRCEDDEFLINQVNKMFFDYRTLDLVDFRSRYHDEYFYIIDTLEQFKHFLSSFIIQHCLEPIDLHIALTDGTFVLTCVN